MMQSKPETKRVIAAGILFAAIYSVGVFELGRNWVKLNPQTYCYSRQLEQLED